MLNEDGILSLYIDRYEFTGGANGVTVRDGDTWEAGFPLRLKVMESNKRKIQRQVVDTIKQRQSGGEIYFEPVKRYVHKYYDPKQYYLTLDGITAFYQEITIAPHSSGIVTFPLIL